MWLRIRTHGFSVTHYWLFFGKQDQFLLLWLIKYQLIFSWLKPSICDNFFSQIHTFWWPGSFTYAVNYRISYSVYKIYIAGTVSISSFRITVTLTPRYAQLPSNAKEENAICRGIKLSVTKKRLWDYNLQNQLLHKRICLKRSGCLVYCIFVKNLTDYAV